MSLIFRMFYVYILSLFRARLDDPDHFVSELDLRVLPNDLDLAMHMNNGRYLTICDLNRIDLFIRSGLLRTMFKRGWMPLIAEHTMTYKKPLRLFDRYQVRLEVTHSDEKYMYMQHTFTQGERIVATGTSKGCVFAKGEGVVPVARALAAIAEDRIHAH